MEHCSDGSGTARLLYAGSMAHAEDMLKCAATFGAEMHATREPETARRLLEEQAFDLAVIDVASFMGDLDAFRRADPCTAWIALLADSPNQPRLQHVITEYCSDYHTLPIDGARLVTAFGHAIRMARLHRATRDHTPQARPADSGMVGQCARMQSVFRGIEKMAEAEAPVLITGESGTGKEVAARSLHERSTRAKGPFIAVNCGALPANLIHAELFGAERGAYTGAQQRRIGRIEAAAGGTLFLDEIGELPADLQACLLRFLQEGTFQRLGSSIDIHANVRIVAATNVDLDRAIAERRFREDLYYRLNVLHIEMPALRERAADIEALAQHFFRVFAPEGKRSLRGFSQEALRQMAKYTWPGNVRELMNRVRRAVVMCEDRMIGVVDLGFERVDTEANVVSLETARATAEREALCSVLHKAGANISRAARHLDISRPALYRLMEKHGVSRQSGEGSDARLETVLAPRTVLNPLN